ncbi:MAG: transporter [Elusimicrobia bacterium]|nr:transporter [Elusimicrobiota bacterium]
MPGPVRRGQAAALALLGLLLSLRPARAGTPDIDSDRGDVTNGVTAVPRGSLQAEGGLSWSDARRGARAVDLPQGLLRLGVLPHAELRLGVPDYLRAYGGDADLSGLGDVSVGVRREFLGLPGGIGAAVTPSVSLPTGAKGVSSGRADPSLELTAARGLGAWTLGAMSGFYWQTVGGGRPLTWQPSAALHHPLGAAGDAFIEYVGRYPEGSAPAQTLHAGATWKPVPTQMVDLGVARGLTDAAPATTVTAGWSTRFDGLF